MVRIKYPNCFRARKGLVFKDLFRHVNPLEQIIELSRSVSRVPGASKPRQMFAIFSKDTLYPVCLAIVANGLESPALRTSYPERGSITGLPIVPLSVERLEPPPRPGPVGSDRTIPVVDFHY